MRSILVLSSLFGCFITVLVGCSTPPKPTEWNYTSTNQATYEKGKYKFRQEYCRERGDERECFVEKCEGNSCTKEGNEEIKTISLSYKQPEDLEKKIEEIHAQDQKNCDAGDVSSCINVYYTFESDEKNKAGLRKTPKGFLQNKLCKKSGIICRYTEFNSVYPAPSGFDMSIRRELQDLNLLKELKESDSSLINLIVKQIKNDPKFLKDAKWKAWPPIRYPSHTVIDPAGGETHLLRNVQIFSERRADYKSYDVNIVLQEVVKR